MAYVFFIYYDNRNMCMHYKYMKSKINVCQLLKRASNRLKNVQDVIIQMRSGTRCPR